MTEGDSPPPPAGSKQPPIHPPPHDTDNKAPDASPSALTELLSTSLNTMSPPGPPNNNAPPHPSSSPLLLRAPSVPLSPLRMPGPEHSPQPEEDEDVAKGKTSSKAKGKGKGRQEERKEVAKDNEDGEEEVDPEIRAAMDESARMAAARRAGPYGGGGGAGPSLGAVDPSLTMSTLRSFHSPDQPMSTIPQHRLLMGATANTLQVEGGRDALRSLDMEGGGSDGSGETILSPPGHNESLVAFSSWRQYCLSLGLPDPGLARNNYLFPDYGPPNHSPYIPSPYVPPNPGYPFWDPSLGMEYIGDLGTHFPDGGGSPLGVPVLNRREGAGVGDENVYVRETPDELTARDQQDVLNDEWRAEEMRDGALAMDLQYYAHTQEQEGGGGEDLDMETQEKKGGQKRALEADEVKEFKEDPEVVNQRKAMIDEVTLWDSGVRTGTVADVARALLDLCDLPVDHPTHHNRLANLARAVGVLPSNQTYISTSTPDYGRIFIRTILSLLQHHDPSRSLPTTRESARDIPPDILWLFIHTANRTLLLHFYRVLEAFEGAEHGKFLSQRSMVVDMLEWRIVSLEPREDGWAARQVEAFRSGGMRLPDDPEEGSLGRPREMVDVGARPSRGVFLTAKEAKALRRKRNAAFAAVRYNRRLS